MSGAAARETVVVVFEAFNRYAGVAIGENLGYLFTGLWTVLISLSMLGSPMFGRWLGWAGLVAAAGILVGTLEGAGFGPAAEVVTVSYILWSIWLVLTGVTLLRTRGVPEGAA